MPRMTTLSATLISSVLALMSTSTTRAATTDGLAGANVGSLQSSQSSQVQVKAHAQALTSAEFAEMRGEYRLADGGRLSIAGVRSRPVAALNDRAAVRLVAIDENRFASVDGAVQIQFNARANGSIDSVTITLPAGTH